MRIALFQPDIPQNTGTILRLCACLGVEAHIIEPADLWQTRIDPRFKERAPYLAHEDGTDQWYADGNVKFGIVGASIQAGLRFEAPEKISFEGRYKDVPLGGIDPHAHIKDMALDDVSGGVLYPTMGLTVFSIPASDLLSAVCGAYNDWLADFCKPYPDHLKGIALLNVDDVEEAVGELQRCAKMGLAGALIPIRPMERRYDHPDYEPLWAAAQDLDIPLSLHTGTARWRPDSVQMELQKADAVEQTNREYHVRNSIAAIILSGVFERYPKLKVGLVEFAIAWAPYFMGRLDNTYKERPVGLKGHRFKGNTLPSDFFRSNVFISFQEDDVGIELRHHVGVDNLLWGSDYPHAESTFPRSREIVERILQGVPEEEKSAIAGGNSARLYHFN